MSLSDELIQPSLEQAMRNHIKVARFAIRLKHSIEADNELAVLIPALKVRLAAQAQTGKIEGLSTDEMLALVHGS